MLGHRLRGWPNINPALGQRRVFTGIPVYHHIIKRIKLTLVVSEKVSESVMIQYHVHLYRRSRGVRHVMSYYIHLTISWFGIRYIHHKLLIISSYVIEYTTVYASSCRCEMNTVYKNTQLPINRGMGMSWSYHNSNENVILLQLGIYRLGYTVLDILLLLWTCS